MKCEADIVSGNVLRCEAPFLQKFFSFPNLPIHCHTVSLFIFNSSAITVTPHLRSERTKFHTLFTFASVLCVFGCPLLGSSCTSSRPSLNHLCMSRCWGDGSALCAVEGWVGDCGGGVENIFCWCLKHSFIPFVHGHIHGADIWLFL